jgi:hypothetical protein
MLVIHRRSGSCYDGGMKRYGSGVLSDVARSLFSSGVKKAISSRTSSAIAHKVADAVVNGASFASKKVADAVVKEAVSTAGRLSTNAVNTAIDSIAKKVKSKKRSHSPNHHHHHQQQQQQQPYINSPALKRKKIDIDSLIDGSGIVYD